MDAFGPIKGAIGTAAVVGSLGSIAAEKGKENKLTEKQQELDKAEAINKEKQAYWNTEAEKNKHRVDLKENTLTSEKLGQKLGGTLSRYDDQNKIAREKAIEEAIANPGKKVSFKAYGNSIEGIRSQYTSKATGGRMSKEKAMEVQGMKFSQQALVRSSNNLRKQLEVKEELNKIRKARIEELMGTKVDNNLEPIMTVKGEEKHE